MSVNLSIKDVPEHVAQRLRERAARHHRSLQGELMAIVERAAADEDAVSSTAAVATDATAPRPQGWKTVEQLLAERRGSGWKAHASMAMAPLAVDIVRADRDLR